MYKTVFLLYEMVLWNDEMVLSCILLQNNYICVSNRNSIMKTKQLALLFFLVCATLVHAQNKNEAYYASLIDSSLIKKSLTTLASDEFEGRGSGERGGEMAMNYIADYLKSNGVAAGNKGSYLQSIEVVQPEEGRNSFFIDKFDYRGDFLYDNQPLQDSIFQIDEVIFVGYGIYSRTYNDYGQTDIKDKVIMKMVSETNPANKYGVPYAVDNDERRFIQENKPKAIISVDQGFSDLSSYFSRGLIFKRADRSNSQNNINVPEIRVNERLANKLLDETEKSIKQIAFEIEQHGKSTPLTINKEVAIYGKTVYKDANICNVVGFIEGSDLKDEYIVISAHHDHLGKSYDRIYNGADDNASGVSALLELSRVLTKAKKEGKGPRRSIIFLFTAAEEEGLEGAGYYVEHPIYPLEKTISCVNIDMIGRLSNARIRDGKDNNYVYVVNDREKSGSLVQKTEEVNQRSLNLDLDYTHTTPGDNEYLFSRSDQYSFAQKGIPAIFFTSGTHDDYHRETDDADRIDYNGVWKRTQLIFYLVWQLANES